MIHLIFGSAAAGSLKHALGEQSHKIIGPPIDFSVGPITNIHENNGISNYFPWLKTSFHTVWNFFEKDQSVFKQALKQLSEIKDGDQVTIWTSENASEQIGLRISCYLLKDKNVTLGYVNTFHAMRDYYKEQDIQIDIRHSGECNAEQLTSFYMQSILPISKEMKSDYAKEGENLLGSKSIVHSWRDGEVTDDAETRGDAFILKCAKRIHNIESNSEFIHATRVIGEVIGHSEQPLSDTWIEYRIRSLIHSHQLDFEGDLKAMRMYKIKVVE